MRLLWDDRAWEDYCAWQMDKKTLRRINKLLKEMFTRLYAYTKLNLKFITDYWNVRIKGILSYFRQLVSCLYPT